MFTLLHNSALWTLPTHVDLSLPFPTATPLMPDIDHSAHGIPELLRKVTEVIKVIMSCN